MIDLHIIGDSNAWFLFKDMEQSYFNIHTHSYSSRTAYDLTTELLEAIDFKNGSIALFYFGFVDIRSYSCRYNNTEEVAKKYVSTVNNYFLNKAITVGFLEPIPSVDKDLWSKTYPKVAHWVSGSLSDREKEHLKFVEVLKQEKLFIPIIGPVLDSYRIDSEHTEDVNHLNTKYNKKITEHVIKILVN